MNRDKLADILLRLLAGIDYIIAGALFIAIHQVALTPEGYRVIRGPGFFFAFGFMLIAAGFFALYDESTFIRAKMLITFGFILTVIGMARSVEELIEYVHNNGTTSGVVIPPFYHPEGVFTSGMVSFTSRTGAILIIISMAMGFPVIISEDIEYARRTSLMISTISMPSLVVLAGAIVAHPNFLAKLSALAIEIIKLVVLIPILSLIIMFIIVMFSTIYLH